MTGIRIHALAMLHLLWLLPVVGGLVVYGLRRRKKDLERFIDAGMLRKNPPPVVYSRRILKGILVLIAMCFIIFGLSRPAWNEKEITVRQAGRDVVFLVDVSRSMLAEDLSPNRLERAKLSIRDCIEVLQGDRVALVAFAGGGVVLCPLTVDYGFFKMTLDGLAAGAVGKGGTLIGDAVRTVLDNVFDEQATQYKDIVLITDGEDHESFPVEAARQAGEKGVRFLIVGLGDEKEGQRIPITDDRGLKTFLKYQGQEVWTKLDADTLRQMANATPDGRYLPVATGTIDLGKVYLELIASAKKRQLDDKTIERYEEKFQIFLAVALLLLLIEMAVSDKKEALS